MTRIKVSNSTSFYFVIEYLEKYQVNYVDIKNNSRESDKFFYLYLFQKRSNRHFPLFLKKDCGISPRRLQKKFGKPLLQLYEDVLDKRQIAYDTFTKNPYAPNWRIFYLRWKSYTKYCWHEGTRAATSQTGLTCYFLGFHLYFAFVWFFLYIAIGFWFLIDLLRGCVDTCRHSAKERAWLETAMNENPDLDSTAISNFIQEEMENLRDDLAPRFPLAKIQVKVKSTRIKHDYHWSTLKQFMFKVSRFTRPAGMSSASSDANHLAPSIATSMSMGESKFNFEVVEGDFDEDDNDLWVPEEDDEEDEDDVEIQFDEVLDTVPSQIPMKV